MLLVLIGGGVWLLFASRPPIDLLEAQTLGPDEIRRVATRLLVHDDIDLRSAAARKLTEAGDSAVPVLVELALKHPDRILRIAVLEVLRVLDEERTVTVVEQLAIEDDAELRRVAVDIAARLSHRGARDVLVKALDDEDGGVLSTAAGACASKGVRDAVPALKQLLNHPSISVRRHSARALGRLTGKRYEVR